MTWSTNLHPSGLSPSMLLPLSCDSAGPPQRDIPDHLRVRSFTLNVQSLKGKHRFIEEQAAAHGCDVLFLQETKCDEPFCESASYIRFSSAPDHHWGPAIWIRKWLHFNGRLLAVKSSDASQLVSLPRLLAVLLRVGTFTLVLASLHVPHQQRPESERTAVLTR